LSAFKVNFSVQNNPFFDMFCRCSCKRAIFPIDFSFFFWRNKFSVTKIQHEINANPAEAKAENVADSKHAQK